MLLCYSCNVTTYMNDARMMSLWYRLGEALVEIYNYERHGNSQHATNGEAFSFVQVQKYQCHVILHQCFIGLPIKLYSGH